MEIDRRAFMASLGGTTAVSLVGDEAEADALESLGYDNGPIAHMWRTIERPRSPL